MGGLGWGAAGVAVRQLQAHLLFPAPPAPPHLPRRLPPACSSPVEEDCGGLLPGRDGEVALKPSHGR
uniref:Uncharacterized protein n=1 Tax=Arundo donax TaxID=35708 RepID=A0A0A9DAX8_ARUDO